MTQVCSAPLPHPAPGSRGSCSPGGPGPATRPLRQTAVRSPDRPSATATSGDVAVAGLPRAFVTYDVHRDRHQPSGCCSDLHDVVPEPPVPTGTEPVGTIAVGDRMRDPRTARRVRSRTTVIHPEDGAATRRVLDLSHPTATARGQTSRTEGDDARAQR